MTDRAHLDHLAATPPSVLRKRLFDAYNSSPPVLRKRLFDAYNNSPPCPERPDPTVEPLTYTEAELLADADTYLDFLRDRFTEENMEPDIERQVHVLLNDLPAMHDLVLSHLRFMWDEFLAAEWARVRDMLQSCVDASLQIDLGGLDSYEVVQKVTGQSLGEKARGFLEQARRVVLVPSAHMGPYLTKFTADDVVWVIFRARMPEGVSLYAPELARSDLLVRLQAVADDTRLRILRYVAEQGELCSQDVMAALDLSQSAASRHLKQLSAAGYLIERRKESAKCYRLNADYIGIVCNAFKRYLQI
ncbi:MAG: winged helix-turn-helix transcriptional regulator [Chloroflexi bacterium]|nr:winged helix-turn-helix transcriptional regulator [Chloroflexota bacterium]